MALRRPLADRDIHFTDAFRSISADSCVEALVLCPDQLCPPLPACGGEMFLGP
jgi:hypothetical protein